MKEDESPLVLNQGDTIEFGSIFKIEASSCIRLHDTFTGEPTNRIECSSYTGARVFIESMGLVSFALFTGVLFTALVNRIIKLRKNMDNIEK